MLLVDSLLTLTVVLPPTVTSIVVDKAMAVVVVDMAMASPLARSATSMDMMPFTVANASITRTSPMRPASAPAMP
jgi:hypothetical protein